MCTLQGAMTEETRQKLALLELTEAPSKAYTTPIPKDGLIYDYRFIKEVCSIQLSSESKYMYSLLDINFYCICWIKKKILFYSINLDTLKHIANL